MRKEVFIILGILLFSFGVKAAIVQEHIVIGNDCGILGYEKIFSFKDANGNTEQYCLEEKEFNTEDFFLVDSYLINGQIKQCKTEYQDVAVQFTAYKSITDRDADIPDYFTLCQLKGKRSSEADLISNAYFTLTACPNGSSENFVDKDGRTIYHCKSGGIAGFADDLNEEGSGEEEAEEEAEEEDMIFGVGDIDYSEIGCERNSYIVNNGESGNDVCKRELGEEAYCSNDSKVEAILGGCSGSKDIDCDIVIERDNIKIEATCCKGGLLTSFVDKDDIYNEVSIGKDTLTVRVTDKELVSKTCDGKDCYKNYLDATCNNILEVKQILKQNGKIIAEDTSSKDFMCIFISNFNLADNLNGQSLSLSLEVKLKDGSVRKFNDIKTISVSKKSPVVIKGLWNIYTTLPINFFILVKDSHEINFAELSFSTNMGKQTVPLQIENVYDDTYLLEGTWNSGENPSNIQFGAGTITLSDSYVTSPYVYSLDFSEDIHLLTDSFSCDVLNSASSKNPINIIFITHNFNDLLLRSYDFEALYTYLFSRKPFDSHKDSFSFYLLSSNSFGQEGLGNDYYSLILNKCGLEIDNVHNVVNIVDGLNEERSHAIGGVQELFISSWGPAWDAAVYGHETGHSFALLADEYTLEEDNTQINFDLAPEADWGYNVDVEGCPKWCNGFLDRSSLYYSYYKEWKSCIEKQGFDKVVNSSGGEVFKKEKELTACYTAEEDKLERDYGIWFDEIFLGNDCESGTDCYFSAHGVRKWRSVEGGIMNLNLGQYGSVSEAVIEDRISRYESGTLHPQEEISSINVESGGAEIYIHNKAGAFYLSPAVIFTDEFDKDGKIVGGKSVDLRTLSKKTRENLAGIKKAKDVRSKLMKADAPLPKSINVNEIDINDLIS